MLFKMLVWILFIIFHAETAANVHTYMNQELNKEYTCKLNMVQDNHLYQLLGNQGTPENC